MKFRNHSLSNIFWKSADTANMSNSRKTKDYSKLPVPRVISKIQLAAVKCSCSSKFSEKVASLSKELIISELLNDSKITIEFKKEAITKAGKWCAEIEGKYKECERNVSKNRE